MKLLLSLLAVFALMGCIGPTSSTDSEPSIQSGEYLTYFNNSYWDDDFYVKYTGEWNLNLKSGGTYVEQVIITYSSGDLSYADTLNEVGTWTYDNNIICIKEGSQDNCHPVKDISNDSFVMLTGGVFDDLYEFVGTSQLVFVK